MNKLKSLLLLLLVLSTMTLAPAPAEARRGSSSSPSPSPSPSRSFSSPSPSPSRPSYSGGSFGSSWSPSPSPAPRPAPAPAPVFRSPSPAPAPVFRSPAPAPIQTPSPAPARIFRSPSPTLAPAYRPPSPVYIPNIEIEIEQAPASAPAYQNSPLPFPVAPAAAPVAPAPAPTPTPVPSPAPAVEQQVEDEDFDFGDLAGGVLKFLVGVAVLGMAGYAGYRFYLYWINRPDETEDGIYTVASVVLGISAQHSTLLPSLHHIMREADSGTYSSRNWALREVAMHLIRNAEYIEYGAVVHQSSPQSKAMQTFAEFNSIEQGRADFDAYRAIDGEVKEDRESGDIRTAPGSFYGVSFVLALTHNQLPFNRNPHTQAEMVSVLRRIQTMHDGEVVAFQLHAVPFKIGEEAMDRDSFLERFANVTLLQ